MGARIREKIGQIIEEHRPVPLEPAVEKKIDEVIDQAQGKLS